MSSSPELNPTVDFIAGTVAGISGLVVGYPFDTVKVRFQSPQVTHAYQGNRTFSAIRAIVREEKVSGLFKGISAPLLSVALMNGLVFASYRFFMKIQLQSSSNLPSLHQITLAGAGSGIVSSVITTPVELIKIRQQSNAKARLSSVSVGLGIIRKEGFRGLYRGMTATALRDTAYGAYFFTYEATSRFLSPPVSQLDARHPDHSSIIEEFDNEVSSHSWSALLLAGGLAGIAGWVTTFPIDVVKTRIQNSTSTLRTDPYRSTWSAISYCYRTEGSKVFWRGLGPTLIRSVPVNMATFATFEAVVSVLGRT